MPDKRDESGEDRQERIQEEQHRPEQNRGYDEVVHGGREPAPALEEDVAGEGLPLPAEEGREEELAEIDNRQARAAQADVRRRERSAD